MAQNREDTIKTKIELSGEKAYKEACSRINAEISELSSEMRLLSSQYDNNADSTEALRKQQDLYNKKLDEQQKKIDAAEDALKELKEAGDDNTEAARRMRIELNRNKAAYNDTEKKVQQLKEEIKDSESGYRQYIQAAKNVDDTLEELSSEMKLLTEETKDSADSAETLRKKHDGLERIFKEQEKKVSALEKAYAAAAKDGDKLGRESNELKIALNNAKTAAAKTENEMRDLERAMDSAGDAADDAEDGFSDFGEAIAGLGGPFGEAGSLLGDLTDKLGAFGINAGSLLNPVTLAAGGVGFALFEMGKFAVGVASETETAMVNFSNQTGIAVEETEKYKDTMQELYTSGYGEDMEDIAAAMARVAQTTGEIDTDTLGDMAKGALTLRDTFDIDIAEGIRGANMLMNTFGVEGTRAFDMIALAAQLGLNQNDNLLDSINEYAVHYEQLGLSVEDMFTSFENAQNAGVFDIDKVGDAIKEFGIRVREGGDDVRDAFKDMGLNADDMVNAFNKGGEAAAGALDQVLNALFAIEDETLKNQMGVALFGTMWEDLGKTGIEAATSFGDSLEQLGTDGTTAGNSVNSAFQNAEGTLDRINNQKFDTLNGQWELLVRNAKTAFEPLGTFVADMLTDALKVVNAWIDGNLYLNKDLEPVIGGNDFVFQDDHTSVEYKDKANIALLAGKLSAEEQNYLKALNQGFKPFEVPITFSTDEKSYAEQLGIIGELDTEPLILAGKRQGSDFDIGVKTGIEEGSPDVLGTAEELGWNASGSVAQAYPGFEESGAWVIKGTETGMASEEGRLKNKAGEIANSGVAAIAAAASAAFGAGANVASSTASGFESMEESIKSRMKAVVDRVVSQISGTVQISATVGVTASLAGQTLNVTQNIYAQNTSYSQQQQQAGKALKNAVRSLI